VTESSILAIFLSMTVTKEKFITIDYTFKTPDGVLLGSSDRSGPLSFQHGVGDIIQGLETRLDGHQVGEDLMFIIPPEEAYGVRDENLQVTVPRSVLPTGVEPQVGMRWQTEVAGQIRPVLISALRDDEVDLDANHPLAGVPLHFTVKILDVADEADCGGCGSGGCGSGGCGSHEHNHEHDHGHSGGGCGSGGCGCH